MSSEAALTYKLLKRLRYKIGMRGLCLKLNDRTSSGYPDFVIVLDGISTWFEAKIDKNKITPIQAATLMRIQKAYTLRWASGGWTLSDWDDSGNFYAGVTMDSLVEQVMRVCEGK